MKKSSIIGLAALLASTVGPIVAIFSYEAYRTRGLTVDIVARAPEKGNFTPQKVTLKAGQKAKIRVRNVDTVAHGFAIPDFGVSAGAIKAGHVAILEVTPQKTGEFRFYCTEWCSEYHLQMGGVIEVVE